MATKREALVEILQDAKRGCQIPQHVLDELIEIVGAQNAAMPPAPPDIPVEQQQEPETAPPAAVEEEKPRKRKKAE